MFNRAVARQLVPLNPHHMAHRLAWRVAEKNLCVELKSSPAGPWQNLMTSHRVSPDDISEPDFHLLVEPRNGWTNPMGDRGVVIEEGEPGAHRTIRIERPGIAGTVRGGEGKYAGSFVVNWDRVSPLSILLRACLSLLCEDSGELLLHGSAVVRGGRFWAFFGPSGCGKSTVAVQLRGGGQTAAVDRVVLGVGDGGAIRVSSTPFSDDTGELLVAPLAGELAGLFYLEQAEATSIEPVGPRQVVPLLVSQIMALSRDRERVDKVMEIVALLAESGIVYRMSFARDESFWNYIDRI